MTQSADKNATDHEPIWWHAIWEFLVHAVVGTALFVLIAFPAIGLNFLILYFESNLSPNVVIVYSMKFVEYAILASDLVLFSVFIIRSVSRTIRLL